MTLPPVTLLSYGTPVDLTNCDREPIHVPGHIQSHGVLLALDRGSLEVLQASDNTDRYLGLPVEQVLGKSAGDLLAPEHLDLLRTASQRDPIVDSGLYLFTVPVAGKGPFHVIGHVHQGLLILELEVPIPEADRQPSFYDAVKHSAARFQRAATVDELCRTVAEEVRRVSGYDRVMIYRFRDDWSGHVIAEDKIEGQESFLGLHYPASDVPSQARALFLKNAIRMLPDAKYVPSRVVPELNPRTGAPLDMSFTFLRGASQMYTEYLLNMGARASLTMAITRGDRLWGMVSCHHYSPRQVPYDVRTACEFLARIVSLQLGDKEAHEEAGYRTRIQDTHDALVRRLAETDDFVQGLVLGSPGVDSYVEAAGVAVITRGECHRIGVTPSDDDIRAIVGWLRNHQGDEVFATDHLAAVMPSAAALTDTAAGVLAIPIMRRAGEYVLWFRPEHVRSVKWAGDPNKPVDVGPLGDRLTPRKSFALWKEEVKGKSEPWRSLEIDAARRLRVSLIEVVLRKSDELARVNRELRQSNQELDSFAYVASHDLKEPLRGIYNYSQFLLEDYERQLDDTGRERLQTMARLTLRMQSLIDSLLHFSRLGRIAFSLEMVDLNEALATGMELVAALLMTAGAKVEVPRPLPTVECDRTALIGVYSNLLSNAAKYNDRPEKHIEVGYHMAGEPGFPSRARGWGVCFHVKDDGIGIPPEHREDVFRIFKRLYPRDAYGGGTGAGLTIVRKVVERHGGAIWIEPNGDRGTTFFFTLGKG